LDFTDETEYSLQRILYRLWSPLSTTKKQIGCAIFTFFIYTLLFNWKIALLLTVGVGFHEYSHLWAAKRMGLQTKGFFLVPFLGGVALVSERYRNYAQQAFVVLAGPVGGGLLALTTAALYYVTGWPFLAASAAWMCYLNLFNLLPLSFMDGGQLMGTITYSINRTLGMVCHAISAVIAVFVLWKFNPFLSGLVAIFSGIGVYSELKDWYYFRTGREYLCTENYLYPPARSSRAQMMATVFGWILTAAILGYVSYLFMHQPDARLMTLLHY